MSIQDDNRDNEVWKDIPGYEGIYQVSNLGRVKSLKQSFKGKILGLRKNSNGYPQVGLYQNGVEKVVTVHSLVMLVLVGERPDGMDINHIDGNKTNNHVSNLEYCSHAKNIQHAYDTGLQVSLTGENNPSSKLTKEQVLEIRARYKSGGTSKKKLAREYGVSSVTIGNIVRRKNWKHI